MNNNEKYSIEKYNGIADNYDESFDGQFSARYKNKMLELFKVSPGDNVLDVGCGNGSLIGRIKQMGDITAFGVDISPNMINECQKRYDNIEFKVSSGETLPFEDAYFDILTICCVLHHLKNPNNFFKESFRVLKSGGTLIVGEPWFPFPIKQIVDYIVSPIIKAGDNKLFSHNRLKKYFLSNGFLIIEVFKQGTIQIITGSKM